MAINPALDYGLDVQCLSDADELFTETSGLEVVVQDCFHLLLSDDFLGPGGDGLGFDCRRLLGLTTDELLGLQPILTEVLERDDRILTASVTLEATTHNGTADVAITIACETEQGPFRRTKSVLNLTSADFEDTSI